MPPLPDPISHTTEAIYRALAAKARQGDNRGVGMADAGNECSRAIFYKLRWSAPLEEITGQKERRFETGRREETRLLDDLEAAGIEVERIDPATGKQFTAELASGWLRGKMDGRALGVPEAPKTVHVVECKSHSDKSFKELLKHAPPGTASADIITENRTIKQLYEGILALLKPFEEARDVVVEAIGSLQIGKSTGLHEGIRKSKPEHFAQCQLYMHSQHLTRCLYLAVNKNDESLYSERIEYDVAFALALEAKIERIAKSDRAPARLFEDPTSKAAFKCSWCSARAQCHEGAFARVNCRTCLSADFRDGAEVWCSLKGVQLSYDDQQRGCGEHKFLPDLVPGEQIDADPSQRTITYRLPSGETWIDGGAK